MNKTKRAYLDLHIAVFLFGFTAILGKLIQVSEVSLVWWRLLFTCSSLILLPRVYQSVRALPRRRVLQLAGIGCIVAVHWVTFFGSVHYSNVSVTLSCMATVSFFTALVEPFMLRQKFRWYELALGLLVIPGMAIIFQFTTGDYYIGIGMGLLSSFLAAIFTILNKKMVDHVEPMPMTFIELGGGLIFLSFLAPFYMDFMGNHHFLPSGSDIFYLLVLALLCTTLAYILSLRALKVISAFTSNLTINLEPVYGIILAWLIFQEHKEMSLGFYLGVAIILFAIVLHPFLKRKFEKAPIESDETVLDEPLAVDNT